MCCKNGNIPGVGFAIAFRKLYQYDCNNLAHLEYKTDGNPKIIFMVNQAISIPNENGTAPEKVQERNNLQRFSFGYILGKLWCKLLDKG
jgi:hypothetical protein